MKFKKIDIERGILESLCIIESGWKDFYHIIYECPENGDLNYIHFFGDKESILNDMCHQLGFTDREKTKKILWK